MTPANIAIVFAPNLLKPLGDDLMQQMRDTEFSNRLMILFIAEFNVIFKDEPNPTEQHRAQPLLRGQKRRSSWSGGQAELAAMALSEHAIAVKEGAHATTRRTEISTGRSNGFTISRKPNQIASPTTPVIVRRLSPVTGPSAVSYRLAVSQERKKPLNAPPLPIQPSLTDALVPTHPPLVVGGERSLASVLVLGVTKPPAVSLTTSGERKLADILISSSPIPPNTAPLPPNRRIRGKPSVDRGSARGNRGNRGTACPPNEGRGGQASARGRGAPRSRANGPQPPLATPRENASRGRTVSHPTSPTSNIPFPK
jgi:hypothetical protein